jgi:hypothetical protein
MNDEQLRWVTVEICKDMAQGMEVSAKLRLTMLPPLAAAAVGAMLVEAGGTLAAPIASAMVSMLTEWAEVVP